MHLINDTIQTTVIEYALPVYNFDNIHYENYADTQFVVDDQLFLETLLMNIRGKTLSYSSYKKKEQDRLEKMLISEINELEKSVNSDNVTNLETKKRTTSNYTHLKIAR